MTRLLLRAVGDLTVTLGALVLLFALWQGWWTDVRANAASDAALELVAAQFAHPSEPPAPRQAVDGDARPTGPTEVVEPPSSGYVHDQAIAIVHLPTIGERRVVREGTDAEVLNQGVLGHYPGTAAPGEVGNFALAGHRTTYGRPLWDLGEMRPGDPVIVETEAGYHVYRFERLEVVEPSRWQVLAPVPGQPDATPTEASMVLTACHPRFSAAERLIGFAVLDRSVPRSEGPPPELQAEQGREAG